MKIRLRITPVKGVSTVVEYAGPVVRIGRDPSLELSLQGTAADKVSRHHARIELQSEGAVLTDLGSSNGTLLNDSLTPLIEPTPVRPGDRIHLGLTGTTLTVLDIDASAPVPRRSMPTTIWLVGGGVGSVAVAILLFVLLVGPRTKTASTPTEVAQALPPQPVQTLPTPPSFRVEPELKPKPTPPAPVPVPVPVPKLSTPPPTPEESRAAPSVEVQRIGAHVVQPNDPPAVLLQRTSEDHPWLAVPAESSIVTASTLIALPGFRCLVVLDKGVHLSLCGTLPELSPPNYPHLLESVVSLAVPPSGIDADIALDRGRIHLQNRKTPAGPAVVRLRFLREVWDVTLQAGSEVAVELLRLPSEDGQRPWPVAVGLFNRGAARLQITDQFSVALPDTGRFIWTKSATAPRQAERLAELPAWWSYTPDLANPRRAETVLALKSLSEALPKVTDVTDVMLTRMQSEKELPAIRRLGMLFLAALDESSRVFSFLEDRRDDVRRAANYALRGWLNRCPDETNALVDRLHQGRTYPKEQVHLVLRLLQSYSREAIARADTYQELIRYLEHDNLAVRELGHWHLFNLVFEKARAIPYDAAADAVKRQENVRRWQKEIPPGTVPVRFSTTPGST